MVARNEEVQLVSVVAVTATENREQQDDEARDHQQRDGGQRLPARLHAPHVADKNGEGRSPRHLLAHPRGYDRCSVVASMNSRRSTSGSAAASSSANERATWRIARASSGASAVRWALESTLAISSSLSCMLGSDMAITPPRASPRPRARGAPWPSD